MDRNFIPENFWIRRALGYMLYSFRKKKSSKARILSVFQDTKFINKIKHYFERCSGWWRRQPIKSVGFISPLQILCTAQNNGNLKLNIARYCYKRCRICAIKYKEILRIEISFAALNFSTWRNPYNMLWDRQSRLNFSNKFLLWS